MSTENDHIEERELAAMTGDLDQLHHDQARPAMRTAVDEWLDSIGPSAAGRPARHRATSRRTFLLGAVGLGAGSLALAACGGSSRSSSPPSTASHRAAPTNPTSSAGPSSSAGPATTDPTYGRGDLAVAAMAVSLENLGVFAYRSGLAAAKAGKLGRVPPAVATFAETAMAQHMDHAQAWNAALRSAGKPAVTATDPKLTPVVKAEFAKVTDVTGLAELALLIENIAAETYQAAVSELKEGTSIGLAASIQPVEMQHAAILYYVLGRYPGIQGTKADSYASGSPLAFDPTALARPASDYQAA